jgi:hypothetical protein
MPSYGDDVVSIGRHLDELADGASALGKSTDEIAELRRLSDVVRAAPAKQAQVLTDFARAVPVQQLSSIRALKNLAVAGSAAALGYAAILFALRNGKDYGIISIENTANDTQIILTLDDVAPSIGANDFITIRGTTETVPLLDTEEGDLGNRVLSKPEGNQVIISNDFINGPLTTECIDPESTCGTINIPLSIGDGIGLMGADAVQMMMDVGAPIVDAGSEGLGLPGIWDSIKKFVIWGGIAIAVILFLVVLYKVAT